MNTILVGIILGVIFGILDVIPMIFMKTGWRADLSAFTHWVVAGFLVSTVSLPIPSYAKGLLIAVITAVPILLIVSEGHIPIIITTLILGLLLGLSIGRFGQ